MFSWTIFYWNWYASDPIVWCKKGSCFSFYYEFMMHQCRLFVTFLIGFSFSSLLLSESKLASLFNEAECQNFELICVCHYLFLVSRSIYGALTDFLLVLHGWKNEERKWNFPNTYRSHWKSKAFCDCFLRKPCFFSSWCLDELVQILSARRRRIELLCIFLWCRSIWYQKTKRELYHFIWTH